MREEEGRSIEHRIARPHGESGESGGRSGSSSQHHSAQLLGTSAVAHDGMLGAQIDKDRILQEVAVLVDRSDIQEELVRLNAHVEHFLGLLDQSGEVGKKMDFLLQEMNREANTLLSKTSGLAGEALKITEMGLLMKSEIEKSREQVQNLE